MGNKSSKTSKNQEPSLLMTRPLVSKLSRTKSFPSLPFSFGTASLSCLAAEHYQIHDQETLDKWRIKALQTINELYEQKSSDIKHEAHVNVLLNQLRAIIDEEKIHHRSQDFLAEKTLNNFHE